MTFWYPNYIARESIISPTLLVAHIGALYAGVAFEGTSFASVAPAPNSHRTDRFSSCLHRTFAQPARDVPSPGRRAGSHARCSCAPAALPRRLPGPPKGSRGELGGQSQLAYFLVTCGGQLCQGRSRCFRIDCKITSLFTPGTSYFVSSAPEAPPEGRCRLIFSRP
jgi:hypothetical protein